MPLVVNSFYKIPKRGKRGQILILKDGYRSGTFVYKGYGRDDGGTVKNGWHRLYKGAVDVRWFGAIGNSRADNTKILNYVFNNFKDILLPKGVYLTNKLKVDNEINLSGDGILTPLKKISSIANRQNPFISINAPSTIDGIIIDGKNKIALALELNSNNIDISNIEIRNIYSNSKGATAIGISTYYGNVTISNVYIHDIYAEPNGIISDSSGMARAIMVGAYDKRDIVDTTYIKDSLFENILGEEGDCIQSEAASVDVIKNLIIQNCKFFNFSRRAIKISTSNALIQNCKIVNRDRYKNLYSAISAFGNNIKIENNAIDITYGSGIECGLEDKRSKNIVIRGNIIKNFKEREKIEGYGVLLLNIDNAIVDKNSIYRDKNQSSAIAIWGCRNVKVINNIFYGGKTQAIEIGNSSMIYDRNILVQGNKYINGKSNYFLSVYHAKDCTFKDNIIKNSSSNLYDIGKLTKNISSN